jgi:hypothetical protein
VIKGLLIILIGTMWLVSSAAIGNNIANKFRRAGMETDPNLFRFAFGLAGLAGIIWGLVELTKALRQ